MSSETKTEEPVVLTHYQKYKDTIAACTKRYKQANTAKVKRVNDAYYTNNKEQILARRRAKYAEKKAGLKNKRIIAKVSKAKMTPDEINTLLSAVSKMNV